MKAKPLETCKSGILEGHVKKLPYCDYQEKKPNEIGGVTFWCKINGGVCPSNIHKNQCVMGYCRDIDFNNGGV